MLEEPKKFIEKFKNIFSKKTLLENCDNTKDKTNNALVKSNKRKLENLVVLVVILIITVIVINVILNDGKTKSKETTDKVLAKINEVNGNTLSNNVEASQNLNLEEKLENILQCIEGVGKVKVLLTYSESSTTLAMYNEDTTKSDTEETDDRWSEKGKLLKVQIKKKLYIKK